MLAGLLLCMVQMVFCWWVSSGMVIARQRQHCPAGPGGRVYLFCDGPYRTHTYDSLPPPFLWSCVFLLRCKTITKKQKIPTHHLDGICPPPSTAPRLPTGSAHPHQYGVLQTVDADYLIYMASASNWHGLLSWLWELGIWPGCCDSG